MSEYRDLETPSFVLDMQKLEQNLKIIDELQSKSGVKILLALKGFALYESFPLIKQYLYGASASSLNETQLAYEKFSKEVHTYSPAYKDNEITKIAQMSDKLIFNSLSQYNRYYHEIQDITSCGLRVNLEMPFDIPSHCNPNREHSRLGIVVDDLNFFPSGVEGLHIHALCSQNSYALEELLLKVQEKFSSKLEKLKWLNLGGGHALSDENYDKEHFIKIVKEFKVEYPNLEIYMEPSESIVYNSGILVASVLDIVHNEIDIAILDISVEVHMSDVMLTKISPLILNTKKDGCSYQLSGNSCAAGDIIGTYQFQVPLEIGDKIIFLNQMSYSMVKSNSFNGINPASITLKEKEGNIKIIKKFSYNEYINRL